ncbi:MAG: hypothetical protein NC336_01295 [Clostridium sp.]|nr:hypothetical protein [Clostridium sp.]
MKNPRLTGAAATVLFHVALLLILITVCLRFTPDNPGERTWPPVDESEILFGGEYVIVGDEPVETAADDESQPAAEAAADPSDDLSDGGKPVEEAPAVISSSRESTVKTKPQEPKPAGPDKKEVERQQQQRREKEAAERIKNQVQFGTGSGSGSGGKRPGSKNGNSDNGALSGKPGTDLKGRSLEAWSAPSGTATGTIVVRVHVNRKGKVTRAEYQRGSGAIAGNSAARESCVRAALKSQFSVAEDAPGDQVGTITYRFE